jgi:hypothetical protein
VVAAARASAARPVEYWLGALDEPTLLYSVFVTLRVGEGFSERVLGRLYCQLQRLVPLHIERREDKLVCHVLCTAPSAQAAAWKTVEQVRRHDGAVLMQVEAGLPGDRAPQVVLTAARQSQYRPHDDDGPEAALCA